MRRLAPSLKLKSAALVVFHQGNVGENGTHKYGYPWQRLAYASYKIFFVVVTYMEECPLGLRVYLRRSGHNRLLTVLVGFPKKSLFSI